MRVRLPNKPKPNTDRDESGQDAIFKIRWYADDIVLLCKSRRAAERLLVHGGNHHSEKSPIK